MILNKVSGGGGKVKINGKPPTEKLNLIKTKVDILRETVFPVAVGESIKLGEDYYLLESILKNNSFYKFNGEIVTQLRNFPKSGWPTSRSIIRLSSKNEIYLCVSTDHGDQYKRECGIFKYNIESDTWTTLRNYNKENTREINAFFELNEEFYLITNNGPVNLQKTTDFKIYTDITNILTANPAYTDIYDVCLWNFKIGNSIYFVNPYDTKYVAKFDGEKFTTRVFPFPEKESDCLYAYQNQTDEIFMIFYKHRWLDTNEYFVYKSYLLTKDGYKFLKEIKSAYDITSIFGFDKTTGDFSFSDKKLKCFLKKEDAFIKA